MWDVPACRCCLSTTDRLERFTEKTVRLFATVTGLEVNLRDGYPMYLCMECNTQLKKAIAFRRKCRRGFYALQQIMTAKKQVTLADIFKVNRKHANLASSMGFWTENSTYKMYCMVEVDTLMKHDIIQTDMERKNDHELIEVETDRIAEVSIIDIEPLIETSGMEEVINNIEPFDENTYQDNEDDGCQDTAFENDAETGQEYHPQDIDPDDVFKGLGEEEIDDDGEWPLTPEPEGEPETVAEDGDKEEIYREKMSKTAILYSAALETFEITPIPPDERVEVFQSRIQPLKNTNKYCCAICVKAFPTVKDLHNHVAAHNKKLPGYKLVCPICKDKFSEQKELDVHLHHEHYYTFKCSTCEKVAYCFSEVMECYNSHAIKMETFDVKPLNEDEKKDAWIKWMTLEKGNRKHKCDICLQSLGKYVTLRRHMRLMHTNLPNFVQCKYCGQMYPDEDKLKHHTRFFHENAYQCKECKEIFYSLDFAKKHSKVHEPKMHVCEFCGRKYKFSFGLSQHKVRAHVRAHLTEHCVLCGSAFATARQLYCHQLNAHLHIKLAEFDELAIDRSCSECLITFADAAVFDKHHSLVHESDGVHRCEHCDEPMPHICDQLLRILLEKTNYPTQCPICSMTMENMVKMSEHLKDVHQDVKVYNKVFVLCETCGEPIRKSYMRQHVSRHKAAKGKVDTSGICSICGYTARAAAEHISHILAHHTTRPYMCTLCPLRYKQRFECKDHILKAHAPVMLFSCDRCTRRFSHTSFLKEHYRKVHNPNFKMRMVKKVLGNAEDKIFVYPDMKIDVSLIDPSLLDMVTLLLHDYSDENVEKLPKWDPYISVCEQPEVVVKPKYKKDPNSYLRKRKAREARKEMEREKQNIKTEDGNLETIVGQRHKDEDDESVERQEIEQKEVRKGHDTTEIKQKVKEKPNKRRKRKNDENAETTRAVKTIVVESNDIIEYLDGHEETEEDETVEYDEVVEIEGEQYVTIDDVLYKIEKE